MHTVSVKLNDSEIEHLDKITQARGLTRSEAIRQAIRALDEGGVEGSFAALAAEFCGVVKDAPADLSTNPDYLDGYGR